LTTSEVAWVYLSGDKVGCSSLRQWSSISRPKNLWQLRPAYGALMTCGTRSVDFVRRWSERTDIGAGQFVAWLGVTASTGDFWSWILDRDEMVSTSTGTSLFPGSTPADRSTICAAWLRIISGDGPRFVARDSYWETWPAICCISPKKNSPSRSGLRNGLRVWSLENGQWRSWVLIFPVS
jgi:hypothetical protein